MHPLKENLSLLTNTQIEDKISKLSAMYFMAQNTDVRHQIILLLDSYKIELMDRAAAERLKQASQQGNGDLDNLINIS